MEPLPFYRNIRALLRHRDLTGPELAVRIGQSERTVRRLLSGATQIHAWDIYRMAEALDVNPGDLAYLDHDTFRARWVAARAA